MSVSQNTRSSEAATASTSVIVTGRSVTALRWYMRIAGVLMILLMILDGLNQNFNLLSTIVINGGYMAAALLTIIGSFGRRVNWLLGVVLTLVWCFAALTYIFIFAGPNGPGPVIQIPTAVIAVIGIVIVVLSYRACARDF